MAGNIEKRGERLYRVRISMGIQDGQRVVHRHTIHGTKKDAERYVNAVLRDKDLGEHAPAQVQTLGRYLDRWLMSAAKARLAPRTYVDYEEILARHVRPRIGRLSMDRITPSVVQDLYNDLSETLQPSTVRKVHAVLRNALKKAVGWKLLRDNPCLHVDLPKVQRQERESMDLGDARKFIAAARQDRLGVVFLVAIGSGLRPQEYRGLQWPDINHRTGACRIQRVLNWRRRVPANLRVGKPAEKDEAPPWSFEDTKTARSRRTIVLPRQLLEALAEHRARQVEDRQNMGAMYQDNQLVFATEIGTPLHESNLSQRHYKKILAAAGLPLTLRMYDLRHACASLWLEKGKDARVVAEQLGHSSTRMTQDTYQHVTSQMLKDASDSVAEDLFSED